jgi:hypothetical protein
VIEETVPVFYSVVSEGFHCLEVVENMAERVGFELALEHKSKDMQRTGCAF